MAKAPARRLGGIVLGTLLATLVAWSPLAVQPMLAAGPLRIEAATTYTIDPRDARVRVAIAYRVTNNKPDTPTTIYYYRALSLGIQADARSIRAADGLGGLSVTSTRHEQYTEVAVRLRANLYHGRTASFTLRYDLVGGKPRSESPIRVSRAFVTFDVWAFGDRNAGTVEVRYPKGFVSSVDGDSMSVHVEGGEVALRAAPADPASFFAIVSGENRAAYDESRLSMPGGAEIVILSWPEDDRWDEIVSGTLRAGFPELQELVGLDWPVEHDLNVRERYTPALEGYAGIFFTDDQRIDISEDLDPVTIMHEAAHAWFNDSLFRSRWIYEGLAEDYAWRVQTAVGGATVDLPKKPVATADAAVILDGWAFPQVVRDDTNDTELYGYNASFWMVHLIVETAGEDQMREAFADAAGNLTAYPGDGQPETVAGADDWRRLLDLTQPLDQPDPEPVLEAVATYVVGGTSSAALADRHEARAAYRELLAEGDGWLPPWYVRQPMGTWDYREAMPRMTAAAGVLALWDQVEAAAGAEGLASDDARSDLEAAYEGAESGFSDAADLGAEQLAAVGAIADAHEKVETEPDLVARLGLVGLEAPSVPYEAARAAFEAGDLGSAVAQAGTAAAIVSRAPGLGQERIVMGAIVLVALVALLAFVVLVRRRRSRRPIGVEPGSAAFLAMDARLAPGGEAAPEDAPADRVEPSGTLGADPDRSPSPPGGAPPDAEGGEPP